MPDFLMVSVLLAALAALFVLSPLKNQALG